jgi:signal transduction histidine kinase
MRRLYQKIYLTIIVTLIVVVAVAGALWRIGTASSPAAQAFDMVGELVQAALPPADAPPPVQQKAIDRLAHEFHADIALFDSALGPIASSGHPLHPPGWGDRGGLNYGPGGPSFSLHLPDNRWLVLRTPVKHRHPALGIIIFLGTIALLVAACAYPVVRGLTRRIERLETGVETLGSGDLSARVKVEGRDEVAQLAESFNRAAQRIEDLVRAHRMLLANASHELRTPLSRIRLGLDLFAAERDPARKAALERDIAELDGIIDEILLASRLDALHEVSESEDVDLLALAAEEGARYPEASVEGEPVTVKGDPRLLRRLIRNLLDNAKEHGRPPIKVSVQRKGHEAVLTVIDQGEGVPEAKREEVFTPFHQLGSNGKGAGLGLALVRRIARLHGGDARVAPRPEAASRFRVNLPSSAA